MQHSRKYMQSSKLLLAKSLNVTSGRKRILEILMASEVGLSGKEIESKLKERVDRATIYRTLKTFADKGIIHPVITENLATKYVIKKAPDNHLHFKCNSCKQVFCLPAVQVTAYSLPKGFLQQDSSFIVSGKCKTCNT